MEKYPADITEEENGALKYPFLPNEQYGSVHCLPEGPVMLTKKTEGTLSAASISRMAGINGRIALRRRCKRDAKGGQNAGNGALR